jgi:2-oxoglutarate ferredoxin oxidoreductase subunit alpha
LLLDKDVSENTFSVNEKIANRHEFGHEFARMWDGKGEYKRYKITEDGISPLAFPGEKNAIVKANSYEHDEFGISNDEENVVEKMQEKRMRKFQKMKEEVENLPAIKVYGNGKSEIALISWGISKGAAMEVAENLKIKLIQPIIVEPFPKKQMERALKGVRKIFSVELNTTGQMAKLLNQNGIKVDGKILKYNGRPFLAKEIEEKLKL